MALNSSGLSAIEISAPARIRLFALARQEAERHAEAGQDERELADLRQARGDRERGVERIAEGEHEHERRERLADMMIATTASTRSGCSISRRGSNSMPTETKNRTENASRSGSDSSAARWLSADSRITMPAKNAPSANETPNSSAEP